MKTVYIGDIHGLTIWEKIVKYNPNADNYVFVGDYFDSYDISGIEQLINAENIVRFKKNIEQTTNKKVYLLIVYLTRLQETGSWDGITIKLAWHTSTRT